MERMTAAQFRALSSPREKKQPKYKNKKVARWGITFDSAFEARRYGKLRLQERAGLIRDLRRQVSIPLLGRDGPLVSAKGRHLRYVADFVYVEASTGAEIVEDTKGFETKDFKLKRAILAAQGVTLHLVKER